MGLIEANEYSWEDAREAYYAALTSTTEWEREEHFIRMYECLGRVLHLIEDMGVPAHTRNDIFGHCDFAEFEDWWNPISWMGNLYEYYVEYRIGENESYVADICRNLSVNPVACARVEDYWDREIYDGTNPESTISADGEELPGLAEYCNANFLSECVMFTNNLSQDHRHYFPYPRETSLDSLDFIPRTVAAEDGRQDTVLYLDKDRDGENIANFVSAKYVWTILEMKSETEYTEAYRLGFKLDDVVHQAYAEKLIPKTVGYTAGVIDCFFRGSIEITLPDNGVYAFLDSEPQDPTTQGFGHMMLMIRNNSLDEELEMTGGSIDLVVKYRMPGFDPFRNYSPYPGLSSDVHYLTASYGEVRDIPRDEPVAIEFDLPQDVPLWATDISLQVVYKGELSRTTDYEVVERNAVCVGFKDISEPTPVDICNNTDFQCMYDNWCYTDESLTPDAPGMGYAFAGSILADKCSGDCSETPACEWLFDYILPKTTQTLYVRFAPVDNPQDASPDEGGHVCTISNLTPGTYKRLFVLSDYEFSFDAFAPGWIHKGHSIREGIMHQRVCAVDQDSGEFRCIQYYPTFKHHRQKEMWMIAYFNHYSIYDVNGCPDLDEDRNCNILDIQVGIEPMQ